MSVSAAFLKYGIELVERMKYLKQNVKKKEEKKKNHLPSFIPLFPTSHNPPLFHQPPLPCSEIDRIDSNNPRASPVGSKNFSFFLSINNHYFYYKGIFVFCLLIIIIIIGVRGKGGKEGEGGTSTWLCNCSLSMLLSGHFFNNS